MKLCKKCKEEKDDKEFYKGRCECKKCLISKQQEKSKTKKGLIVRIYANQKSNSKNRGRELPTYTKRELQDWLFAQEKFHLLYDNWKRLDFQKDYTPSVDRKDDYIGYTISNIQLMTWKENNEKANNSRVNGTNNKHSKAVEQYTKDGVFLNKYYSQQKASRVTGVKQQSIGACCLGKQKTAGNYIWKFEG